MPPLNLIKRNYLLDLDIARFSYQGNLAQTNSEAYCIDDKPMISLERTKKNIGTAAYICGFPGFLSEIHIQKGGETTTSDSIVAYNKYYSGIGGIISADENVILCDFAEKEFLFNNAVNESPTGGERNIQGMSGSGLWVYDGITNAPNLLGILLGKNKKSNPQNEHLIEFAPVWKLVEILVNLNC